MEASEKATELAQIIADAFQKLNVESELRKIENGVHHFTIGAAAPNMVAIKLPTTIDISEFEKQGINYSDRLFKLVDTMIEESGYKINMEIVIHIYRADGSHYEARRIFPSNVN